ncbi:MAG: permease [Verrucomicrobia bacterium]|nr:permease [Verrucomicrobiota bacterium]
MHVFWFEFILSLRRLARRKTQNGLMLLTFAMSIALSLLSWSLFYTIFLSQPEFDPRGEYFVLTYAGSVAGGPTHSTADELGAYQKEQTVFSEFAPVTFYSSVLIGTPLGAERALTAYPSARALQMTGARPLLGRLFTPEEDKGSERKVLLSEKMWTKSFGRDPDVVGKAIDLVGRTGEIVGVLPAGYRFPNDQDLWICFGYSPGTENFPVRDALVKLKPGVTRDQALREVEGILARRGPTSFANKKGLKPVLMPLRDFYLPPEIRVSAVILFSLSLIFVIVSCTNAANLMLIDFLGRRSEVASMIALGVPRRAAIRGVCFQVGVIAFIAALLGLAFLPVAGPLLYDRIKIINAPYWLTYHFQWRYVGVAFVLAAGSAIVTVVAPILFLLWMDPDQVIREHAYSNRGSGRALWRRLLLMGQIALLTVLGVSAELLIHSSYHVGESQWGYPAQRVFLGKISAVGVRRPTGQAANRTAENTAWLASHLKTLESVKARPETAAAAFAENPPGYSGGPYYRYALDPAAFGSHAELGEAFGTRTTEGLFDVLAVPLVAGKTFPRENPAEGPTYAVINESLAQRLWPREDPLQRTFYVQIPDPDENDPLLRLTVCGVVRDFQSSGPLAINNDAIYFPYKPGSGGIGGVFLLVRDRVGVPDVRSLTEAVHRADPRVPLFFPSTIAGQINLTLSSVRMTTGLTTLFAVAAVLLCAIGIYSLTVAQVLQSSREFGIRMALGAESGRLWRDFSRGHLVAALIGVALGLVGASQAARVLRALLFGVDPHGVMTYAGVALAILVVAALACIPSLFRLKRINPAECLRSL